MTDPKYTHVSLVIDRSGSMSAIREDAEGGIRSFMEQQKAIPGKLTVSLWQFDDVCDEVYRMRPIADVPDYKLHPRGLTALLDSMHRAIVLTGEDLAALSEDARPANVIFVVVTDGLENASNEVDRGRVFQLVKQQTDDYGWHFAYLAANQDAIAVGRSLGVTHNTTYEASPAGTRAAYDALTTSTTATRGGDVFAMPDNA